MSIFYSDHAAPLRDSATFPLSPLRRISELRMMPGWKPGQQRTHVPVATPWSFVDKCRIVRVLQAFQVNSAASFRV